MLSGIVKKKFQSQGLPGFFYSELFFQRCYLDCDAVPVLELLPLPLVPSGDIGVVARDPAPPSDLAAAAAGARIHQP